MANVFLPMVHQESASGAGCATGCGTHDPLAAQQESRLKALDQEFRRVMGVINGADANGLNGKERHSNSEIPASRTVMSTKRPLPLAAERTHRAIEGSHLWVAVREGALLVLNDDEHAIFSRIERGQTLEEVLRVIAAETGSEQKAWDRVSALIGRAATAGFFPSVRGYTQHQTPKPDKFARFHITKACQLECIHCYSDSSPHVDRSGELTVARWKRLIGDYAANGGVEALFTGGEALVYKGCTDLLAFAREQGLFVTLFSNGLLIPRHIKQVRDACNKVQISLDGPDEATNDGIRGNGVYKRALDAVELLLQNGVRTVVSMTVMHENWDSWKDGFLAFAAKYAGRLDFKVSYGVMQYGRGTELEEVEVEHTRNIVDDYLAIINGEIGPKVTRTKSGCGYGEQLVVGPDGVVYPCHLLDAGMCHIDDHPISEIVSKLNAIVNHFDVDHIEGCDACDIRYLCGGKCRVIEGRKIGTRLVTTCTATEKHHKLLNLVHSYRQRAN